MGILTDEMKRVVTALQLCYAATVPHPDETSQSQQEKFPVTDVFSHVEVADGRVWMLERGYSATRVSVHLQASHRNVRSSGCGPSLGWTRTSFIGAPHFGHLRSGGICSGTGTGDSASTAL